MTDPGAQPGLAEQPLRTERVAVRPTEGYFAGFGGYTFGGKFDTDASGSLNGAAFAIEVLPTPPWSAPRPAAFSLRA
jgi:hypothetical protein